MTEDAAGVRRRTILFAAGILAFVATGQFLRSQLGLEASVEAVRTFAQDLGWRAPLAFVGLVTVRQLFFLPASLLLTAGGVVFGGGYGAALGGTGIICSALVNFALARRFGPAMLPDRLREFVRRHSSARELPLLATIALVTAHPIGPMALAQWTAGCSTLAGSSFFVVVTPTSYFRAGTLAAFGASLPQWGSPASILLTLGLAAAIALPFAFPAVRRRLLEPMP